MTQLWLIRHGETDWNKNQRFQGSSDQPLNERGTAQAKSLTDRLKDEHFDAVYSSDLQRAHQTAQYALETQSTIIQTDARLREIDFGIFEGLTWEQIRTQYPEELAEWEADRNQNPHGGETLDRVVARVDAVLSDVVMRHSQQKIALFGHGGTLAIMLALLMGTDPVNWWQYRMLNCAVTVVKIYEGGAVLIRFNDSCHLDASLIDSV